MKSPLPVASLLLGASLSMLACAEMEYSARANYPVGPVSAELGIFYDDLAPYGSWVTVAGYGEVWVPRVSQWWRPYTEGHWVFSDDGWTWIADEPWGWAPFHYGRWYVDSRWGWAWVPGRVWAPAWVAWRSGGAHVGWAPLPPQARWEGGAEFGVGSFDFDAYIAPQHWSFVEERYITAPAIREYLVPSVRSVSYVRVTNNITNYTVVDSRIVNRGLDVSHVERVTQHAVPRYQFHDRSGPGATTASEGRVWIYRPTRHGDPARNEGPPSAREAPAGARETPPALPRSHTQDRTATPVQSPREITTRHETERHDLERHQAEERARVRQLQEDERKRSAERAKTDEVRRQHDAEGRGLKKQQQDEQRALGRRQKEERKTATQGKAQPRDQSKQKKDRDKDQPH
jgi:hypothetical protein